MSADHLAFIRTLPCAVCGVQRLSEAHHLLRTGEHGMGKKSSDRWAIPLCQKMRPFTGCHQKLHNNGDEEGWLADRGVDGRSLARQLWANTDDHAACLTILYKARNHG